MLRPLTGDGARQLGCLRRRQVGDVDVRRAGVAPRLAGRPWPAGDLEDLEAIAGRPVGDIQQRRLGERRGQEPQLHGVTTSATERVERGPVVVAGRSTSTQRPVAALAAMASPTSISSWPSAKVA